MTQLTFEEVWTMVESLSGAVETGTGRPNQILKVDGRDVVRRSSTGRRGRIPIHAFRVAVELLEADGHVDRDEIYEATRPLRVSSGVVAVLGALHRYERVRKPVGLRLREG
jgi:hypothetical protein